ncbi:DUF4880 domain-containing protein [Pseudomonas syringae]|nr:DUF4880 domain-containing protein [Pseudomonas syringae]MBD8573817.1 DUF4880 domain-containing protein [Pseudomonas syringae]MBD8790217.1 DUF4880 domain-containing protein [Pseudomonas syringae]MBD8803781.1 DUF4880 domain-containing protein [Pseudomonas syringae]MBD8810111.1 DUF4880 domain-containing protein [Pseudomonas syringae]
MSSQLSPLLPLPTRTTLQLNDDTRSLARRLRKLSRRTRQIFLLSRLENQSYPHIARFLDVDVGKVERAMLRVMRHAHRSLCDTEALLAAHDQADAWYIHLQSPAATASQRIEFRHWLDAHPSHLAAFQASERLWRRLQAPAALLGASGWHQRKRRAYLSWYLATGFVCSLMMTAEAFS